MNTTYSGYKEEVIKWNSRIHEHTKLKRFKQDPDAYLINIDKMEQ